MTRRRSSARFFDPTGARFGIPTWPWRMAPPHLRTLRQLAAEGLRPGGQDIAGQVLWNSRRSRTGVRAAYLYDVRLALPKRVPTDRQRAALGKALAARRHCPTCRRDAGYVLPRHLGECLECAEGADLGEAEVTAA
ncbi:RRQRL motif-containing zinc-binding protein [Actinomadura formosensis]|uniref:RRQRL motif-containing zinc-binding protein n=1 Tax=Actinomadura formosensis TaxID=60706 RepID=UPI00082D6740|nr:RRQRL motif-containing zinc-binding protein [Actinomadura formosensis]